VKTARYIAIALLPLLITVLTAKNKGTTRAKDFGQQFSWRMIIEHMPRYRHVFQNPEKHKLRLIYTQINRDEKGRPHFNTYHWAHNSKQYYYPASIIKLPTALMALEKMNKDYGSERPLFIYFNEKKACGQSYYDDYFKTHEYQGESLQEIAEMYGTDTTFLLAYNLINDTNQPETGDQLIVGHHMPDTINMYWNLEKMLVFSENKCFNFFYDYLGQHHMNQRLRELGYRGTRIIKRLLGCDTLGNRYTLGHRILDKDMNVVGGQAPQMTPLPLRNNDRPSVGKSYYLGRRYYGFPRDFTYHNRMELEDLHRMLMQVMFPKAFPESGQFRLNAWQQDFVRHALAAYPREVPYDMFPELKPMEDSYVKFFYIGHSKAPFPDHIRTVNIVGWAYGTLLDCAYITDFRTGAEFFLSAIIYTNNNGVLGDGRYEYSALGWPFLRDLGRTVLAYEQQRERKFKTDFSDLKRILNKNYNYFYPQIN
jgi:hypothetical protein